MRNRSAQGQQASQTYHETLLSNTSQFLCSTMEVDSSLLASYREHVLSGGQLTCEMSAWGIVSSAVSGALFDLARHRNLRMCHCLCFIFMYAAGVHPRMTNTLLGPTGDCVSVFRQVGSKRDLEGQYATLHVGGWSSIAALAWWLITLIRHAFLPSWAIWRPCFQLVMHSMFVVLCQAWMFIVIRAHAFSHCGAAFLSTQYALLRYWQARPAVFRFRAIRSACFMCPGAMRCHQSLFRKVIVRITLWQNNTRVGSGWFSDGMCGGKP